MVYAGNANVGQKGGNWKVRVVFRPFVPFA